MQELGWMPVRAPLANTTLQRGASLHYVTHHSLFSGSFLPFAGSLLFAGLLAVAEDGSSQVRQPADNVNDAALRERPGLRPNENLLFNGWGVTPAGQHATLSDLPLKLIVSPDGKFLLAVSGGFNNAGFVLQRGGQCGRSQLVSGGHRYRS